MAYPEGYSGHQEAAEREEVHRDINSLKDSFYMGPQLLKAKILRQNQQHILVRDALEEIEFFYDDVTLPEKDMVNILRLAHATPSERDISPTTTVTRLLRDISQIEGFQTEKYGLEILHGTAALSKKKGESLEKHAQRIAQAEEISIANPKVSPSLGKQMTLDALLPITFTHNQIVASQQTYEDLYREYQNALPKIFGSRDYGLWKPKIQRGIEIGKAVLRIQ